MTMEPFFQPCNRMHINCNLMQKERDTKTRIGLSLHFNSFLHVPMLNCIKDKVSPVNVYGINVCVDGNLV